MFYKTFIVFFLLISSAYAGINAKDVYCLTEPIIITCDVPATEDTETI